MVLTACLKFVKVYTDTVHPVQEPFVLGVLNITAGCRYGNSYFAAKL